VITMELFEVRAIADRILHILIPPNFERGKVYSTKSPEGFWSRVGAEHSLESRANCLTALPPLGLVPWTFSTHASKTGDRVKARVLLNLQHLRTIQYSIILSRKPHLSLLVEHSSLSVYSLAVSRIFVVGHGAFALTGSEPDGIDA
jgi:hypothetical protein